MNVEQFKNHFNDEIKDANETVVPGDVVRSMTGVLYFVDATGAWRRLDRMKPTDRIRVPQHIIASARLKGIL